MADTETLCYYRTEVTTKAYVLEDTQYHIGVFV